MRDARVCVRDAVSGPVLTRVKTLQWGEMVERVSAVMMRPYCTGVFVREKTRRNGSVSCGSYESQAIV